MKNNHQSSFQLLYIFLLLGSITISCNNNSSSPFSKSAIEGLSTYQVADGFKVELVASWEHEGYEPGVSPFTPSAAKDLTESVIGYLQGEMRNKE